MAFLAVFYTLLVSCDATKAATPQGTVTQTTAPVAVSTIIFSSIQALGVIAALCVTGYQVCRQRRELKYRNYLDGVNDCLDLMKMMVANHDLHPLYDENTVADLPAAFGELTAQQKSLVYYCDAIIFLCERVWVSQQEGCLAKDEWSYWRKWIHRLNESPYFRWTVVWVEDDYEPDFIAELRPENQAH